MFPSVTKSLTDSLNGSLTHSTTHSLTHSMNFTHSTTHLLTHSMAPLLTQQLTHLFTSHSLIHTLTQSLTHPINRSHPSECYVIGIQWYAPHQYNRSFRTSDLSNLFSLWRQAMNNLIELTSLRLFKDFKISKISGAKRFVFVITCRSNWMFDTSEPVLIDWAIISLSSSTPSIR